ncbi:uncharacterized protein B0H18DRAFT_1127041 [Fomitopsis serialis]|uniref:uncharacterized protein n=2 Tax=Fomitopsis serialis TaxID=139415 RepID=UPI0020075B38|nr:uncharacterized protein B0H18DRAFT_1127041 [Neoantrodia serialis]KAH9912556.1 hypothetical protein B0H18DRAFT_1127041 [Neoantrodia serialis]
MPTSRLLQRLKMLSLVLVFAIVKYGLAALPQGPPVPNDVIICFAGETDDYRKIAPQFDQGDPAIDAGAGVPLRATVLIVRLPCGKYAILSSSLPGPAAPVCMVLSKNTATIVSKRTLTVRWSHAHDLYQAQLCDTQDLRAFVRCFRENSVDAPSDADIKDDAYIEEEIAEDLDVVSSNYEACLEYGAFADDEWTWRDVRAACWILYVIYVALHITCAMRKLAPTEERASVA